MAIQRKALGRGLDSLISMDDTPARGTSAINDVPLDKITPNPDQPRTTFDEEALAELAASIRELGIIQPLSLRKTGADTYQIIAGERRFRAARLAGLESVPAYVRTANEAELTEMALIENIQREDLNSIEVALGFKKLIDTYSLTQERLSERLGKKRATIANHLRLLKLPAEIQLGLRDRNIDMGHARAILAVSDPKDQLKLYKKILREELSVRAVERIARDMAEGARKEKLSREAADDPYAGFASQLSQRFSTPVKFTRSANGKGSITIRFSSDDELHRLIKELG